MRILYLPNEFSQQRQREKKSEIYPVLLAMQAQWHRNQGFEVYWNIPDRVSEIEKIVETPENIPFLSLPIPDRVWSKAEKYTSGNYKYLPGTHMQVADGCWHGKCTFCVEKGKSYEVRNLGIVTDEIIECIKLGFKEIFDDSGTFPVGKWLDDFCFLWKDNKAVKFGCNMRLVDVDYEAMKNAGFRMLLFGIESANQDTLDKINKGVKANEIIPILKKATRAGLEAHGAFMFGYPWESEEEELETLNLCHYLLRKGYLKTAQGSTYCVKGISPQINNRRKEIYKVCYSPEFWYNKIKGIKDLDDLKYLWRQIQTGLKDLSTSPCIAMT